MAVHFPHVWDAKERDFIPSIGFTWIEATASKTQSTAASELVDQQFAKLFAKLFAQ